MRRIKLVNLRERALVQICSHQETMARLERRSAVRAPSSEEHLPAVFTVISPIDAALFIQQPAKLTELISLRFF
ncbi:MAG TPA: hypothetical protein VM598_11770 [Bdellovibrionota bacterium]|nr:hypothetical protein [Bdellovibrionota bacterium]